MMAGDGLNGMLVLCTGSNMNDCPLPLPAVSKNIVVRRIIDSPKSICETYAGPILPVPYPSRTLRLSL